MIEAIDNMGDVEEEDTDEEGNSTFKQSQPIPVYIQLHVVKWIQAGKFIDMAELLPDHLGIQVDTTKKDEKAPKIKSRRVTSILEWVQCYGIHTAIISAKFSVQIQDMLGYQPLIVEVCMEYEGDSWLGYDRQFRQTVAASPGAKYVRYVHKIMIVFKTAEYICYDDGCHFRRYVCEKNPFIEIKHQHCQLLPKMEIIIAYGWACWQVVQRYMWSLKISWGLSCSCCLQSTVFMLLTVISPYKFDMQL